MSERSERVGRPSDAPPTPGLATGVAAERATTTPPEDPPAATDSQRRQPRYEEVRVRASAVRVGSPRRGGRSLADRPSRVGRGGSVVGGSTLTFRSMVLRCRTDVGGESSGGVPVGRSRRRLPRGPRQRRELLAAMALRSFVAALNCHTPPPSKAPPPTARYCCAAPALARRQQSLRSDRQAPTLLRRCGAGLAHTFITGADVGDHRRWSVDVRRTSVSVRDSGASRQSSRIDGVQDGVLTTVGAQKARPQEPTAFTRSSSTTVGSVRSAIRQSSRTDGGVDRPGSSEAPRHSQGPRSLNASAGLAFERLSRRSAVRPTRRTRSTQRPSRLRDCRCAPRCLRATRHRRCRRRTPATWGDRGRVRLRCGRRPASGCRRAAR